MWKRKPKMARGEVRCMSPMSDKEREYYDAQAYVEAWEFALGILNPWVEAARAIGSPELTRVMEKARDEAGREYGRATEELRVLD
jgi:hypothetical protein